MSAQSDFETEPAAASIHRPSAKASAKAQAWPSSKDHSFLDYDFSNSTCQAIFSSGTVDPAASAQKPAAAAAAPAGDLVCTDEFWASLDL